jgi:RNA polymerase sigma-70 factor, ECF subfamily
VTAPLLRLVPQEPLSDGALCRAYLTGDVEALGQLLNRHQASVLSVARRYARSPDEARELAQRALVQAVEAASRAIRSMGTVEEVPFRQWLLRIVINLGKNAVRDGARRPLVPVDSVVMESTEASAEARLVEREKAARVRAAVSQLSARQHEVFTLRVDAELPFAQIALTLGISEVNAKVHFHQAVKRLRQVLNEEPESGGRV